MVTLVGERRPDLGFGQVQVQLPAFGHDFAERTIDALGHRVGVCRERTALPWPQKSARSSAARNPSACIASISSGSSRKPVGDPGSRLNHDPRYVGSAGWPNVARCPFIDGDPIVGALGEAGRAHPELRHTAKVVTGDRQVHLPGRPLKMNEIECRRGRTGLSTDSRSSTDAMTGNREQVDRLAPMTNRSTHR